MRFILLTHANKSLRLTMHSFHCPLLYLLFRYRLVYLPLHFLLQLWSLSWMKITGRSKESATPFYRALDPSLATMRRIVSARISKFYILAPKPFRHVSIPFNISQGLLIHSKCATRRPWSYWPHLVLIVWKPSCGLSLVPFYVPYSFAAITYSPLLRSNQGRNYACV